jgi:hypothetical protein
MKQQQQQQKQQQQRQQHTNTKTQPHKQTSQLRLVAERGTHPHRKQTHTQETRDTHTRQDPRGETPTHPPTPPPPTDTRPTSTHKTTTPQPRNPPGGPDARRTEPPPQDHNPRRPSANQVGPKEQDYCFLFFDSSHLTDSRCNEVKHNKQKGVTCAARGSTWTPGRGTPEKSDHRRKVCQPVSRLQHTSKKKQNGGALD